MGITATSIAPFRTVLRCGAFFCAAFAVTAAVARSAGDDGDASMPDRGASRAPDAAVDYSNGVRIDWRHRAVEVDAKVCLTRGPLELLLCSPNTREHESVFVTPARPMHVYEALGLIGLTPGKPVHYQEETERWVPPTGERVEISVTCTGTAPQPISHFVKRIGDDAGPISPTWVFAGSKRFPDGRFGADPEGTIIAVVDFETAIVAPSSLHSDSNEALWLEANSETVPKIGTQCVVRLAAVERGAAPVRLRVTAGGGLERDGTEVSAEDVARLTRVERPDPAAVKRVVLLPAAGVDEQQVRAALEKLVAAGVPRDRIAVAPPSSKEQSETPPAGD